MARNYPSGQDELFIYGAIPQDVTAKAIADALRALGQVRTLHLRVHSPGGSTSEAAAIITLLNQVRARGTRIIVHIDGAAFSAAAWIIAATADEVVVAEDALVMIHDASLDVSGRAEELRRGAAVLDKVSTEMRRDIALRMHRREDEVAAMMLAETWWTADEAVEQGFADRIEGALKLAAAYQPQNRDRSISAMAERYWANRGGAK
ncbi:MAG TPA: head maturation protease, ClpP-related [Devosia sp.]|jgi:ATP-dependent Clp protease protease subunit|uniref:head maturation protease, ClpP-related n=1 Tax=Devosia sp. TaxID=1871048 RepID=UPI002DDD387E|nr:head maturation protease, ClpP-related [Devosia sp.]HEV2517153.1 head maturation protease, ClpP-related [Devosia sp.]